MNAGRTRLSAALLGLVGVVVLLLVLGAAMDGIGLWKSARSPAAGSTRPSDDASPGAPGLKMTGGPGPVTTQPPRTRESHFQLVVTVRDEWDGAVTEGTLRVVGDEDAVLGVVAPDAAGRFRAQLPRGHEGGYVVVYEGSNSRGGELRVAEPEDGDAEATLYVLRTARVVFELRSPSGDPVDECVAQGSGTKDCVFTFVAQGGGRYQADVRPGFHTIRFRARGYQGAVALDLHPGQNRTVTVQLSKTAEPLAIRVRPAKPDEEAALYRVRVRCGSVSEALALRPGETSAPLELPTGTRLVIGVRPSAADEARTFVWDNVASILADGQNPLTVRLPVTAEVRILLVDDRGHPVHGADLRLRRRTDDTPCFRPALSARTSADGIAVFPHLPLGDYAVSLTPVVWRRGPDGMRGAEPVATFSVKDAESLRVRCAATKVRQLSARLVGPPSPERFEICAEYEIMAGDRKPRTRKREMRSKVQPDGSWALALPSSGDEPVTLRLLGPARNVVATTVLDAGQSSHTFSIAEDGFAGAEVLVRDGRRIRVTGWLRLVREDEAHPLSTTGRPINHQTGGATFEWLPVGPYVVQYSTELGRGDWRPADSVVLRRDRRRFEVDLAGVEGVRGR